MISRRNGIGVVVSLAALGVAGAAFYPVKAVETPPTLSGAARTKAVATLTRGGTVDGSNRFAFKLLSRLATKSKNNDNLFVSPLSLEQALLLLANGAAGNTRSGVLHALQQPTNLAQVNQESRLMGQLLAPLPDDPKKLNSPPAYEWTLANAIWTRRQPGATFALNCKSFYNAEAFKLTTVTPINAWVNQKTKGRIPTILQTVPPNTGAVLTNAVYFKGRWVTPFEPRMTEENAKFQVAGSASANTLPRMNRTEQGIPFYKASSYQAISLPYRGGMKMVVILPNAGISATNLAAGFTVDEWKKLQTSLLPAYVHVGLPRFEMEYSISLLPDLKAMGLPISGDFSPMGQGSMSVGAVVHKTFLRVDEKGTEAAASTGIMMPTSVRVDQPKQFIVDRPFLCAIVHEETGAILFTGVINNPKATK